MLGEFFCNPVLPARDGDRARRFYRDALGLELVSGPSDDPMFFRAGGGSAVVVTEIPDREPSSHPVVSFLVTGIERIVEELRGRGVEFLAPETSTFAGVAGTVSGYVTDYGPVRSAMLRDSEGNVLALNELVG
jgi:catechol 2,3-dioxygenase-like lactoylglutathione lyase family enzyme